MTVSLTPIGNVESLTLINPKPNAFGLFDLLEFRTTDLREKNVVLVNYGPLRLVAPMEYSIDAPRVEIDLTDILYARASRSTYRDNAILARSHSLNALSRGYEWMRGRGIGASLYCAAALCADVLMQGGARNWVNVLGGIYSVEGGRTPFADKLWASLVRSGIATRTVTSPQAQMLISQYMRYTPSRPFTVGEDYYLREGGDTFTEIDSSTPAPLKYWTIGNTKDGTPIDLLAARTVYELGIIVDMKTDATWFMNADYRQRYMQSVKWVRPSADMLANIDLRDPRDFKIKPSYYRYVVDLIKSCAGKDAVGIIDKLNARPDVAEFLAGRKRSTAGLSGFVGRRAVRLPAKLANWPSL